MFNGNFIDYIDWDHVWWTEQGIANLGDEYSANEDYSFTAGISFISFTEALKYHEKIGCDPKGDSTWWSTRTERGLNAKDHNILVMKGTGGEIWNIKAHVLEEQIPSVRPVFYLNEDFFREVRIGLKNDEGDNLLGENVRQMLLNRYTREELAGIYTDEELAYIGYDAPSYATISVEADNGAPTILTARFPIITNGLREKPPTENIPRSAATRVRGT